MKRLDTDILKSISRTDSGMIKWLEDSLFELIDMANQADPDKNMELKKDCLSKICLLKEIIDSIKNSNAMLYNMRNKKEEEEQTPKVNIY